MIKLALALALTCVLCLNALPQARVELSPKAITDKVDLVFAKWNKPDSPGCALGVIRDGRFVYARGYGMANLDYGIPIDTRSVFYIASVSKQFTAMSIALLAEQGKLSLDDDIRKHLPEMPRYQRPVTVRHLIHHTSGIRDFIVLRYLADFPVGDFSGDDENYEKMARTTNDENVALIARQKALNIVPGDEYLYSNSNYILLAEIVRRVSGKPLSAFADENIFGPLGMADTHYYDDLSVVVKNRAVGYSNESDGRFVPVRTNNGTVGPAGVFTTIDDLIKWDRNFYDNKLGKGGQGLIDMMLTRGVLNSGEKLSYALGLVHYRYKGLDTVGHGGYFFGSKTAMYRFPEQRFTVICLCNSKSAPVDELVDQVTDIYLADRFKPEAPTQSVQPSTAVDLTPDQLARFAGLYRDPITEALWMLSVKDGKLFDPGSGGQTLVAIGEDRFRVSGQSVELKFEVKPGKERPLRLLESTPGRKPRVYRREVAVSPSAVDLTEFAGTYRGDEIDASYTFIVRDGKLWLLRKNGRYVPFEVTLKDHFWSDEFGYLGFTRDARSRITGLSYSGGLIRHMRFDRRVK